MKKIQELIAKKTARILKINKLVEDEARARTEDEVTEQNTLRDEIKALKVELKNAEYDAKLEREAKELEDEQRHIANQIDGTSKGDVGEKKELGKIDKEISAKRIIHHVMGKKLIKDGPELEMNQEAIDEFRRDARAEPAPGSINIPVSLMQAAERSTVTSNIAPTTVGGYIAALREEALWPKVGVTEYQGLTADFRVAAPGKHTVGWAATENAAASDTGVVNTSDVLTPNRITGYVPISNELLLQNGEIAYQASLREIGGATSDLINDAMFATASVTNAPPAIAAITSVGTFTEAPTYSANTTVLADMIKAEQTLADAEGLSGNLAYVCATNLLAELKKSAQVASVLPAFDQRPVFGQGYINGYLTFFTTSATKSAGTSGDFVFGNWKHVSMGWFGGMSITRDTVGGILNNITRIVVHRYVDWGSVRSTAFVKATSLVA